MIERMSIGTEGDVVIKGGDLTVDIGNLTLDIGDLAVAGDGVIEGDLQVNGDLQITEGSLTVNLTSLAVSASMAIDGHISPFEQVLRYEPVLLSLTLPFFPWLFL